MKKILLTTLLSLAFITTQLNAKDTKQTMTDEEFLKKYMELEQRKEKAKTKTKQLKQLNKSLDKLTKKLGVDK